MTNMRYQHTQIGYLTIGALLLGVIGSLSGMIVTGFNWVIGLVLIALTICLGLFATLTVSIDGPILHIRFGPGIIRKTFLLHNIEACQVVRNPWYYGWGIHLTPAGWLYNVSGFNAVELHMKDRKRCRIGTDDPEGLSNAIQQSLRENEETP